MAWLTTAPSEWTIDNEESSPAIAYFRVAGEGGAFSMVPYQQITTSVTKHKSGMNYATATAARDSYLASNPKQSATVPRGNDAGMYELKVVEVIIGAWEEVT